MHKLEPDIVAANLGAENISEQIRMRYRDALHELHLELTPREESLLAKMLYHPFLFSSIDGGLALLQPQHVIRKRILVMAALLETDSAHAHQFISTQDRSFAIARLLMLGVAAVIKGLCGVVLIKLSRWI